MRVGLVLAVAVCAGCFDPTPPPGLGCAEGGLCPAGQRCDLGTNQCVPADTPDAPAAAADAGVDGGPAVLGFLVDTSAVGENTGATSIAVVMSQPLTVDVGFDIVATGGDASGADFTLQGVGLELAAGETSVAAPVAIIEDALDEDDEMFVVALSNVIGATADDRTHTVTIGDNDPLPAASFDPAEMDRAVPEGAVGVSSMFAYRVVLSAPSGRTVTVPVALTGSAEDNDYTIPPTDIPVVFPAGTTARTINITVTGDAVAGMDEVITMTLETPTNATLGSGTVRNHTIVNDD